MLASVEYGPQCCCCFVASWPSFRVCRWLAWPRQRAKAAAGIHSRVAVVYYSIGGRAAQPTRRSLPEVAGVHAAHGPHSPATLVDQVLAPAAHALLILLFLQHQAGDTDTGPHRRHGVSKSALPAARAIAHAANDCRGPVHPRQGQARYLLSWERTRDVTPAAAREHSAAQRRAGL